MIIIIINTATIYYYYRHYLIHTSMTVSWRYRLSLYTRPDILRLTQFKK